MDLLERARALAGCSLFGGLAPAVVIRLAERAFARELAAGERCTTDDTVWVIADGAVAVATEGTRVEVATVSLQRRSGSSAGPGGALGVIRVVVPATLPVVAVAGGPTRLVGLELDDVRDILEEDPAALAALVEALSRLLLEPK